MNIIRKTINGQEYVKNIETNRWVKQKGRVGTKIMVDNNMTRIGDEKSKIIPKFSTPQFTIANKKNIRGDWVSENKIRKSKVSLSLFANAVINDKTKTMKNALLTIRAKDKLNDYTFRTIKLSNNMRKADLLKKLLKAQFQETEQADSDKFSPGSEIDTTFFKLTYKENMIGNSGRKDCKKHYTEHFDCISYPGNHGDCLLVIIKAVLGLNKIVKSIRKKYKIPNGGIEVSYIPKLEEIFKVNIMVYDDWVSVNKKYEDCSKYNKTITSYEHEFYYKSDKKYNKTIEVLLKDSHYYEIVKKKELFFDPTCGDRLLTRKNIPIKMSKIAIKKSLIRQGRTIAGSSSIKDKGKKMWIFFDIETIFNPELSSLLQPYSVAWHVVDPEKVRRPSEKSISKLLKETHFEYGIDCMEKFVKWIERTDEGISYTLIGYNNSRFDNFPLLRSLINADLFTSMLFVQNSILQLNFGGKHNCFDLCRFVMCSLNKACKDFNIFPKKLEGFSHYVPQDAFMENGWIGLNSWIEDNKEALIKYNKLDVLATESLFFTVKNAYSSLVQLDILDYTTLASLSFDKFSELNKRSNHVVKAPDNESDDLFIRDAIVGGRCQKFNIHTRNNEELACVDVKSLYPYIMLNRSFPYGDCRNTKKYIKDKMGVYNIIIKSQPSPNILPKRCIKEKTLDWDYKGEIETTATSVDIECLSRHGAIYEFVADDDGIIGICWDNYADDIFDSYFEPIKNEKTRQDMLSKNKSDEYNPALRNITKLLLNSLSGKMVQRNFTDKTQMVKNKNEEEKFMKMTKNQCLLTNFGDYRLLKGDLKEDKVYKSTRAKPSYLGVFIYSYARSYMYDIIYSNYDTIYTDTDSGILNKNDWNDFKSKYIKARSSGPTKYYCLTDKKTDIPTIGSEFGQFEEEFESEGKRCESYMICKKIYCMEMRNPDGSVNSKSKYRIKGVSLLKDRLITEKQRDEIIEKSRDGNIEYIYNLKKKLDKEFDKEIEKFNLDTEMHKIAEKIGMINIYRALDKGEVYFLCGGIKKSNLMTMKQSYSIKKIKNDEVELEDIV